MYMLFTRKEKINFTILVILMIFGSFSEAFSIAVIFPFINLIINPESLYTYPIIGNLVKHLDTQRLIIYACLILMIVFLFKNIYLIFTQYIQARFIFKRQISFWERLLRSYLNKPYDFFYTRNIAELQRNVAVSINDIINGEFLPLVNLLCECCVSILILIFLFYADWVSTLLVILILSIIFGSILFKQKKTMRMHGKNAHHSYYEMLKWTNQSINSVKTVKIRENQEFFLSKVRSIGKLHVNAATYSNVMQKLPQLLIEATAVITLCIIIVYSLLVRNNLQDIVPVITLFAVSAYRLLPSLNRIFSYINRMRFSYAAFNDLFDDLYESKKYIKKESIKRSGFSFKHSITIKELSFSYNEANGEVLRNINMTIPKGSKIGIVGVSGQGKTTLLDLFLGLLSPKTGQILVDEKDINDCITEWHSIISYIPQETYLMDDTIINNITIGIPNDHVDFDHVRCVLQMAQIYDFVVSLPNGWDTFVGDNGVRLSGGQRQRIAIARALYTNPLILVLDEATSALDNDTETSIINTLDELNEKEHITMVIVSHRESTIKKCDIIYKIDGGVVF